MLAYSSIEHTGLTCLGLALGPLGAFAALLHLVNHSLVKSVMFLLSGRMYRRYRTTDLAGVTGLLRTMPVTGALFTAGMLAVVGLPPFGLFLSELALVRAGFARGRYGLMLVVLALLALAFISLVVHLNRMLHGPARYPQYYGQHERQNREHQAWLAHSERVDDAVFAAAMLDQCSVTPSKTCACARLRMKPCQTA